MLLFLGRQSSAQTTRKDVLTCNSVVHFLNNVRPSLSCAAEVTFVHETLMMIDV